MRSRLRTAQDGAGPGYPSTAGRAPQGAEARMRSPHRVQHTPGTEDSRSLWETVRRVKQPLPKAGTRRKRAGYLCAASDPLAQRSMDATKGVSTSSLVHGQAGTLAVTRLRVAEVAEASAVGLFAAAPPAVPAGAGAGRRLLQ